MMFGNGVVLLVLVPLITLVSGVMAHDACADKVDLVKSSDTVFITSVDPRDDDGDKGSPALDNKPQYRLPTDDTDGWVTYAKDVFVELDFGSPVDLVGFTVKGADNYRGGVWVTSFTACTKLRADDNCEPILISGRRVIAGNSDTKGSVHYDLPLTRARFFRLEALEAEHCCWEEGKKGAKRPDQFTGLKLAVFGCPPRCRLHTSQIIHRTEGDCEAEVPVTSCKGLCLSSQAVDVDDKELITECECCRASNTSMVDVVYRCKKSEITKQVQVIDDCDCQRSECP